MQPGSYLADIVLKPASPVVYVCVRESNPTADGGGIVSRTILAGPTAEGPKWGSLKH